MHSYLGWEQEFLGIRRRPKHKKLVVRDVQVTGKIYWSRTYHLGTRHVVFRKPMRIALSDGPKQVCIHDFSGGEFTFCYHKGIISVEPPILHAIAAVPDPPCSRTRKRPERRQVLRALRCALQGPA